MSPCLSPIYSSSHNFHIDYLSFKAAGVGEQGKEWRFFWHHQLKVKIQLGIDCNYKFLSDAVQIGLSHIMG